MINVIIPAYNCSKTLERTLASLVAQTDQNFEVIIVDDCSTENIKNIINDYDNKLKIIYIRNEKNIGCGMSRAEIAKDFLNAMLKSAEFVLQYKGSITHMQSTINTIINNKSLILNDEEKEKINKLLTYTRRKS